MWSKTIDYKSPVVAGVGVGAKIAASLRAGVDVQLNALSGAATLDLNDAIKWFWTKSGNNIILNSAYDLRSANLQVSAPSLDIALTGRGDFDLDVDFNYKTPGSSWRAKDIVSFRNTEALFNKTLSLANPDLSLEFYDGLVSMTLKRTELETTSNTLLTNGIKTSGDIDLVAMVLDIDKAIELYVNPPQPPKPAPEVPKLIEFNQEVKYEFDGVEVGAELSIFNVQLSETAKLRQDITATVDKITGSLIMENGASIGYTVGNPITLPLSTYDVNGDGQLALKFDYTKAGTVTNKTDFVLSTDAEIDMLGAKFYAKTANGILDGSVSYSVDPLFNPPPINLLSIPFNIYQDSWAVNNLGIGSSQLTIA
jgi:hypothetical protein